ncbi:MAG: universal stress protein [Myxococcales bacterium]|nr:universal stress protein [Myxococcales bacterium]
MKLDDFESVFRSSVKTPFHHAPPNIESALLVTDVDNAATGAFLGEIQPFLASGHADGIEWTTLTSEDFQEVSTVLDRVRRNPPSLVVCYRHLLGQGVRLPYSLGSTVDTLTQATDVPVLLLPRPDEVGITLPKKASQVMVVTDHLTGDDRLVNWAAHLCTDDGTLFLSHIEDKAILKKYLDACSKIPGIDFDLAKEKLPKKLLAMPSDYIASTSEILAKQGIHENVQALVKVGDPVKDYEQLVEELGVDLLIMNTKDHDQNAMHALAYALSVEIRNRPLLLL